MKLAIAILSVFVTLPISFYLQYAILKRIDASELMWFLFWVNVPLILLVSLVTKLMKDDDA